MSLYENPSVSINWKTHSSKLLAPSFNFKINWFKFIISPMELDGEITFKEAFSSLRTYVLINDENSEIFLYKIL